MHRLSIPFHLFVLRSSKYSLNVIPISENDLKLRLLMRFPKHEPYIGIVWLVIWGGTKKDMSKHGKLLESQGRGLGKIQRKLIR